MRKIFYLLFSLHFLPLLQKSQRFIATNLLQRKQPRLTMHSNRVKSDQGWAGHACLGILYKHCILLYCIFDEIFFVFFVLINYYAIHKFDFYQKMLFISLFYCDHISRYKFRSLVKKGS